MKRTGIGTRDGAASSEAADTASNWRRIRSLAASAGLSKPLLPGLGGLLLFSISLLGLPLSGTHLAQFEALNRELGKLCSKPPPQALNVCRLHARLLSGL